MTYDPARALNAVPDDPAEPDPAGRIAALQAEVHGLRQAMVERSTIEQAKGMLMMRYAIPEPAAFQLLVRWSSASNFKLRVVAKMLVDLSMDDRGLLTKGYGPDQLLRASLGRGTESRTPER